MDRGPYINYVVLVGGREPQRQFTMYVLSNNHACKGEKIKCLIFLDYVGNISVLLSQKSKQNDRYGDSHYRWNYFRMFIWAENTFCCTVIQLYDSMKKLNGLGFFIWINILVLLSQKSKQNNRYGDSHKRWNYFCSSCQSPVRKGQYENDSVECKWNNAVQ